MKAGVGWTKGIPLVIGPEEGKEGEEGSIANVVFFFSSLLQYQ